MPFLLVGVVGVVVFHVERGRKEAGRWRGVLIKNWSNSRFNIAHHIWRDVCLTKLHPIQWTRHVRVRSIVRHHMMSQASQVSQALCGAPVKVKGGPPSP